MKKSRIYVSIWLLLIVLYLCLSGSYEAFLLFAVSVAAIIISSLLLIPVRKAMTCKCDLMLITNRGEEGTAVVSFTNQSFLPIPMIICKLGIYNQMNGRERMVTLRTSLRGRQSKEETIPFRSEYSGMLTITVKKASITDYFGVFSYKAQPTAKGKVLVLPELYPASVLLTDNDATDWDSVNYSEKKSGTDASEIFGVREYIPGDSLHKIHWKLSGKWDDLYVKEGSLPIDRSILLYFETSEKIIDKKDYEKLNVRIDGFVSVSQALLDQGKQHYWGWFDWSTNQMICESVENTEDLAISMRRLLGTYVHEQEESGLMAYANEYSLHPFAHIGYVTGEVTDYAVDQLREMCSVEVINFHGETLMDELNNVMI